MTETRTIPSILRPDDFHHTTVRVGDLNMHAVIEGPDDGPMVVLLHGFPEFWYSWRYQIKALAAAGYRVVAPDQRGYNLTDKKGPYDVFTLTSDAKKLVHALGRETAVMVGHDWGGIVAWLSAAFYPETFTRLIACNCPHPMAGFYAYREFYLPQILDSMYVLFFQIPVIPEALLTARNFKFLGDTLQASARGNLSDQELDYFREAWSQPGALHAGLNYYRALVRHQRALLVRNMNVCVPTFVIWGLPDPYLTTHTTETSRRWCPQMEIQFLPGAGHFVQQNAPDEVNRLMLGWLGSPA